jgi:hypothetical protein
VAVEVNRTLIGDCRLTITPCNLDEANAFIEAHHRHHGPMPGAKFSVACSDEQGRVHGVVMVGRPIARLADDGWTLEVNRLCTDGTPNACSMLYAAAWRVTRELGYRRLITYILDTEPGTSLKAAGWRCVGSRGGGSWSRSSRPRVDKHPLQGKLLWEAP